MFLCVGRNNWLLGGTLDSVLYVFQLVFKPCSWTHASDKFGNFFKHSETHLVVLSNRVKSRALAGNNLLQVRLRLNF